MNEMELTAIVVTVFSAFVLSCWMSYKLGRQLEHDDFSVYHRQICDVLKARTRELEGKLSEFKESEEKKRNSGEKTQ